jgi:hypothetical protein
VPDWESVFYHPGLCLVLSIYVDDFKMSGPQATMRAGWALLRKHITLDDPEPSNIYLGCQHRIFAVPKADIFPSVALSRKVLEAARAAGDRGVTSECRSARCVWLARGPSVWTNTSTKCEFTLGQHLALHWRSSWSRTIFRLGTPRRKSNSLDLGPEFNGL